MAIHRFDPVRWHTTFAAHDPVFTLQHGDTLVTHTVDAAGVDATGTRVAPTPNPLTGPFRIEGARPGDRLRVRIEAVRPDRGYGFARASLAPNVVDPDFVPDMGHDPRNDGARFRVSLQEGTATLWRDEGPLAGWTLPLAPMLGCIGVAPAGGEAISSATSGAHGGNMDVRRVGPGAEVILPVFEPGALLFVGDAHAAQGDGEISGTGIEISAEVHLSVRLERGGAPVRWPRGRAGGERLTMGNARPLDQATQHATTEMVRWLMEDLDLSAADAGLLMSQTVRYDIGNVFDPAYTVVCRMPEAVLDALPRRDDAGGATRSG
jgi:acetamidase/formamidase